MFKDTLSISLAMQFADAPLKVPNGGIREVKLCMEANGFAGRVKFTVTKEELIIPFFKQFIKPDLIEFVLSIQGVLNQPEPLPPPLAVKGVVTQKSVREYSFVQIEASPVLMYDYEIEFKDAAQVLWGQHFPVKLYTDASMSDVIKDNEKPPVSMALEWAELEKKHHHICLALGDYNNQASFYDFLFWYVHSRGGNCYYDYLLQQLCVSGNKQKETPVSVLDDYDIDHYKVVFPETIRNDIRILNVSAETPQTLDIKQEQSVSGIVRDRTVRTDIANEVETEKKFQQAYLDLPLEDLHLELKRFPPKAFTIGTFTGLNPGIYSKQLSFAGRVFRIYHIDFHAVSERQGGESGTEADDAVFKVEMTARLEQKDDPVRRFPAYKKPWYPLTVEGKIVSNEGEETDKTYQFFRDEETSLEYYHVLIPLWGLTIRTPYVPDITTGHFYFPAFKHARVLVDLSLHTARLNTFLDWGAGARLPMDSQGNHILFGKNDQSETSMRYVYEENLPLLSIKRTSSKDTELIKMSEESILLQTKEEE